MVRIIGNSPERVPIPDLGDVIYYKQTKDYSDQEFERSKDLKRERERGRIVVIEQRSAPRGSISNNGHDNVTINQHTSVDIETIKKAVKEVLPEAQPKSSMMDVLKDAIPLLINTVRQEMSSLMTGPARQSPVASSSYQGPEYVPEISTEGMISHVKAEEKEMDGSDTASTLEALRRLKNKSK